MDEALQLTKTDWPVFGLTDDVRPTLGSASEAGQAAVLVTLHTASGGAPRGVGAQMVVTQSTVSGYLSGGCIEADVARHALAAMADGQPRRLVYGEGGPIDVRLPCGGRIELLAERVLPEDPAVACLLDLGAARKTAVWISTGATRLCCSDGESVPPEGDLSAAFLAARQGTARAGQQGGAVYRTFAPRQRFVVFGHDPTALAMAMLARQVGMETFLVRPKGPSAPPPMPDIQYRREAPAAALATIGVDPWTAVAIAMHQDEDDHEALVAALSSSAGYVGLLGSSRRLPGKIARLTEAGISPHQLARLKAPIGLKVGGHSPWEIATGVIAEVIQTANGRPASQVPVHAVAAA
jgi:xanthine dehydrogenase accessory factor